MNLEEIKQLMKDEKGKIIIVENEEPTLVILPYGEYRNYHGNSQGNTAQDQVTRQEEKRNSMPAPARVEQRSEGLTIDDLPL